MSTGPPSTSPTASPPRAPGTPTRWWKPRYGSRSTTAPTRKPAEARADFLTRSGPIVHEPTAVEDPEASAEAQRAERRKVLALNKLGAAAQQVRRAWVRDRLLARLVDCTYASSL
jgi:hypothetical protein